MFEKKEKCYFCGLKAKKGQEFNGHPCCMSCKIRKEKEKAKKEMPAV